MNFKEKVWTIFIILFVLTVVEYLVARWTGGSASLLFVMALAKTVLIVNYFMHIYRLWREEEH